MKRVNIPKPEGGVRQLGVPTVLDRLIGQAILQVLQPRWDPEFSQFSYGFRPKRSAQQAVARAQSFIAQGCRWVVDLDLEKFFDRVNHDRLMAKVAERIADKRLLRLIRAYLNAGVMDGGLFHRTEEGVPQGGPLSPLLSNLVLDELDRELERRGHRFVRYADDCNIYVRSKRAGQRVMDSVTAFITKKLKLQVNREKSTVGRPWVRKFLGLSFTSGKVPKRRISPQALARLRKKVRRMTRPVIGMSLAFLVGELSDYLRGWRGYFGFCETPSVLGSLDSWIQRRIRSLAWRYWKRGRTRYRELRKRGLGRKQAAIAAGSAHGPWRMSRGPGMHTAFPRSYFQTLGFTFLAPPRDA